MVKKFRKKPVVIEAIQWDRSPRTLHIMNQSGFDQTNYGEKLTDVPMIINDLNIQTLEGNLQVLDGDWIIKGINGEIYPCKPDIFEKTYELVEEDNA